MDPNTLNLKNQNASQGTPQMGGTGMYAQTPTAPAGAVYTPSAGDEAVLDDIQKELRTRFELLPKEIQDTIVSSEYQMKLFELAKKYKITYADLGQLELETTMVLLGMTKPTDFLGDLKAAIKKDDNTMGALVNDIDEQIFSAIRKSLVTLYEEKEEARENATPAIPLAQELTAMPPKASPMQSAGVEFKPSQPTITVAPTQAPVAAPQASAPALEKHEDDMLKSSGIDVGATSVGANPQATVTSRDSFTSKLTGVFGVKPKATDHTLPKMGEMNTETATAKPSDPYREQI